MQEYKRLAAETDEQYIYRICEHKSEIGTWQDVSDIINQELSLNYTESAYRKMYQNYNKLLAATEVQKLDFAERIAELRLEQERLKKERYKLSDVKNEYNRWLREDSRDEHFIEKICQCIENTLGQHGELFDSYGKPIRTLPYQVDNNFTKTALLNIADMHFGKEFTVYDIHNRAINSYSPEIYFRRMEILFNETIRICKKEGITLLKIFNLGDSLEGFLRHSQIWSLRYGVVDSAVILGDFLANWLKKLSSNVKVEYHQTNGNHGELRLLDGRKGEHLNENIETIVEHIIEITNKNNNNFNIVRNKSGFIFTNICGYNILGIHGEIKSEENALREYSEIYNTRIDYLISGHKHHGSYINSGIHKGVIGVGSIIGTDEYSLKLRKTSDPSCTLLLFEEGRGKTIEYTISLTERKLS